MPVARARTHVLQGMSRWHERWQKSNKLVDAHASVDSGHTSHGEPASVSSEPTSTPSQPSRIADDIAATHAASREMVVFPSAVDKRRSRQRRKKNGLEKRVTFKFDELVSQLGSEAIKPTPPDAVEESEIAAWREHFAKENVPVASEVKWGETGRSLYFHDPDGHVVEVITPGFWEVY